jgi:hypothetical protein
MKADKSRCPLFAWADIALAIQSLCPRVPQGQRNIQAERVGSLSVDNEFASLRTPATPWACLFAVRHVAK